MLKINFFLKIQGNVVLYIFFIKLKSEIIIQQIVLIKIIYIYQIINYVHCER